MMKRLTKSRVLSDVFSFGFMEERELVKQGKEIDANQIRYARKQMIAGLTLGKVKDFAELLDAMTEYTIDSNGYWKYNPVKFVHDEYTRNLVCEFKSRYKKAEVM